MNIDLLLDEIRFDDDGLVMAIAQDAASQHVLMVAYMNRATLRQTLESDVMTYWSRSREEVWVKGRTSGNMQHVVDVRVDCDGDALLFLVEQEGGAACHTGHRSCFFRRFTGDELEDAGEQVFDPDDVYG